jgi:hypothetical protein
MTPVDGKSEVSATLIVGGTSLMLSERAAIVVDASSIDVPASTHSKT